MTRLLSFFKSIFYLLITALGVFIMFTVTWANNGVGFFGIAGFFLIGYGSLYSSISIARLILPFDIDFNFKLMSDKLLYNELKNKVGKTKVKIISITYISIFIILFVFSFYTYFIAIDSYENEQLKINGETQKVLIYKTGYKGKGGEKAYFDFYYNEKKYSDHLPKDNLQIGDSAVIIFSKQNPDIIEWYNDFKQKDHR
jgi:hypothetical protein